MKTDDFVRDFISLRPAVRFAIQMNRRADTGATFYVVVGEAEPATHIGNVIIAAIGKYRVMRRPAQEAAS